MTDIHGKNATDITRNDPNRSQSAIKLSAQNLWKVYGHDPRGFFVGGRSADADRLVNEMRSSGHIPAAIDVSFDLHAGEIFVIMGLSGSGKSTVIRCLSRLVEATSGQVLFNGEDLLAKSSRELTKIRRHKMGMVFQNFGLLPHLTVLENVAFPLKLQGLRPEEQRQRAQSVISLVGLEGRELSLPGQLSGGQQQRVGIARSLVTEPEIWFLDEPFSALDPLIRRQMQDEFLRLQQKLNKSIVFITHDFMEALRVADRMAIMRDGRIVQIGRPQELVLDPADDYVAQFTREVPRIRILQAGDCVKNAVVPTAKMPRLPARIPIEVLIRELAASLEGVAIDDDGKTLGVITPSSLIQTLAAADGR